MTPEQFASTFSLLSLKQGPKGFFRPNEKTKAAAVLVPVVCRDEGLNVLLTQRAQHLRHHPGQISFPGGRRDDEDIDLVATALRETEEEIGLSRDKIQPLGWLPEMTTITNYQVYPLVGLIKEVGSLRINPDEVEDVFEVPLHFFLSRENHEKLYPIRQNKKHEVHFMPYKDKLIWGATAAILDKLASHFE